MRRGILAGRDELGRLRERRARPPFDRIYDFLRARCGLILETGPVGEPQWRAMAAQGAYAPALLAARTAQGRMIDLLVAHHVEANPAYRDRAAEELRTLTAWSAWTDPSHSGGAADLCTAEAALGAAVALDWLWEDLGEADRLRVLHAIRHKAVEPYLKAVREGAWWYSCYHAWNAVTNSGCALAGLALGDDLPAGQEAYQLGMRGLKHFFDALGREGGWDEGLGTWGYAMRYALMLGEAASRLAHDRSIFHARGMDATGLFPVYFTPNGRAAGFGDMPSVPLLGALYLLVRHFGMKELTWWLDTYSFHRDAGTTDWSAAGLAYLLRPTDVETPAAPELQPLKVFHEIGWAAMADCWPRPALYVAAKAGDLAAHNSQHDMNSVQVQVGGEMLLTDPGHAPLSAEYFSGDRGEFYEVQAHAHNTITLGGQDHVPDAQGEIVEAQAGANYRWIACDAGAALGENARFVRHVVLVVQPATQAGHMVVVVDEVSDAAGRRVDLCWHTEGRVELDRSGARGVIVGRQATAHLSLLASAPFQTDLRERSLGPGRTERIVRLTAPGAARLLLVSVFSPLPLEGKAELKKGANGDLRLTAGGVQVKFRGLRKGLQLESVSE